MPKAVTVAGDAIRSPTRSRPFQHLVSHLKNQIRKPHKALRRSKYAFDFEMHNIKVDLF